MGVGWVAALGPTGVRNYGGADVLTPTPIPHSIRKTFITKLENLGIAENVMADIVGHKKATVTCRLYSGGSTLKVKAAALAKITYGKSRSED